MKKPFSIVFLGTDQTSLNCLNKLIDNPDFDVKGVITQPVRRSGRGWKLQHSVVAQRAQELSLPVLTPDNLKSEDFLSVIKNWKVDWAVVLAYGKILPLSFLSLFPKRALNFHASLLPRWRGAAPVQRAIMAGDQKMGMSLQVMETKLDTGAIVGVRSFPFTEEMDAAFVFKKMDILIEELLKDLREYMENKRKAKPQKNEQAIYAHKITKKESVIAWSDPVLKIFNQIRALTIGPQAYTFYKGKRLKIYQAMPFSFKKTAGFPGQIVKVGSKDFVVACQNGTLKILRVQPESKRIMWAGEYLRGCSLREGEILGQ